MPEATAIAAFITAPSCAPALAPPDHAKRVADAGGVAVREHRHPVDVVDGQPGVLDREQRRVEREIELAPAEATTDLRDADPRHDRALLELVDQRIAPSSLRRVMSSHP
jgi:hypothetical protein